MYIYVACREIAKPHFANLGNVLVWYSSARPARTEDPSLLILILTRKCPLLEPSLRGYTSSANTRNSNQEAAAPARPAGNAKGQCHIRRVRTLHIRQDSVIPDHGGRPSGNDKARGGPGGMADAPSTGVGVGKGLAPAGCLPPVEPEDVTMQGSERTSYREVVHL